MAGSRRQSLASRPSAACSIPRTSICAGSQRTRSQPDLESVLSTTDPDNGQESRVYSDEELCLPLELLAAEVVESLYAASRRASMSAGPMQENENCNMINASRRPSVAWYNSQMADRRRSVISQVATIPATTTDSVPETTRRSSVRASVTAASENDPQNPSRGSYRGSVAAASASEPSLSQPESAVQETALRYSESDILH